ncbi:MAG: four helix bundle protein [Ignavibacteriales bacterium]|nr:four helix bundle protein [Ignavibacteriales bacterium]
MKTFEEIPVYQKSKELCVEIYRLNNSKFQKDFGFKDQIQRAAISVMNNIAEGFERGSNKDFVKFLYYSKGSVGEIRSLLNVAVELGYIEPQLYEKLKNDCLEISKQLSNFIKYLSTK